ncbi:hypothetical protein QC823_13815 [Halomonas vilamensis]|uniref:Uncharacterized protein n=1 Tax=Vreelandella vilamensis TaxID=531309 RepID=A0ABU1H6Z1_9GAMM|nr:hypothetical protein [Halomonas vilamensis]MDR5900059.1 hypothetical protein [Halomonas vilamensis]
MAFLVPDNIHIGYHIRRPTQVMKVAKRLPDLFRRCLDHNELIGFAHFGNQEIQRQSSTSPSLWSSEPKITLAPRSPGALHGKDITSWPPGSVADRAFCRACTVIVDNPDGSSEEVRTCITGAPYFDGKKIRTVEGHAQRDPCAGYHGADGEGIPHVAVAMKGNATLRLDSARNLVKVIAEGINARQFSGFERRQART